MLGRILFALFISTPAWASGVCSDLLTDPGLLKVLQQIENLVPPVLTVRPPARSLKQIYLDLKTEEDRVRQAGLSEGERDRLRSVMPLAFNASGMGAGEVNQFYLNSLRDLSARTARFWRFQEARAQMGSVMSPEVEAFSARLIHTYFSPFNMDDAQLSTENAARMIAARPWMFLPWPRLLNLIRNWFAEREIGQWKAHEFTRWATSQPADRAISLDLLNRMDRALTSRDGVLRCCRSDPGCVRCPQNRRWRRGLGRASE